MHNKLEKPLCVIFFKEMLLPFIWRRLNINIFFLYSNGSIATKISLYYVVNFDNYVVYIAFRGRNMEYLKLHKFVINLYWMIVFFKEMIFSFTF